MPKVVPEYLEQRRQQILDAAAACFARKGFHQTTMQDICDAVGLSPGAVYRYFRGKEEIIEGMTERGRNQSAEAIQSAMSNQQTQEAFADLARLFFLELEPGGVRDNESCAIIVELISEAPRNERIRASVLRSITQVRGLFEQLVRRSQARGEIDPDLNPESVARVMIALYHGLLTQRLVEPDLDLRGYSQVAAALFAGSFWRARPSEPAGASESAALRH